MCEACNQYNHHVHSNAYTHHKQFLTTETSIAIQGDGASTAFIDTLISGNRWTSDTVSYTFNSIQGKYGDEGLTGYNLFNYSQQTAAKLALAEFEKIIDISFTENTSSAIAGTDIVFRAAEMGENMAGWAFQPSDFWGSDITIDNIYNGSASGQEAEYYGLEKGRFGFKLLLHEIGHAMGLDHPHESGLVSAAEDSFNASVMSYYSSDNNSIGGKIATAIGPTSPQTLMIYDIIALQEVYGANHNYNAGDNTYSLNGDIYVGTIWDGNGIDTLDSSSYTGNVTLELREGLDKVSWVGNTHVWNAFGANIENAVSGIGDDIINGNHLDNYIRSDSGNDSISGNEGDDDVNSNKGNDTVYGGGGDDMIRGGKDNDTIYGGEGDDWLNGNNQNDIVHGQSGNDRIHGGKDNDTIYGGDGDDDIYGDKGNDVLYGENGIDSFIFYNDMGQDIIMDFDVTTEIIILNNKLATDTDSVVNGIDYVGGNAIINFAGNQSITLSDMEAGSMNTDNFMLI